MIAFDEFARFISSYSSNNACIEIHFSLAENEKFVCCFMGRMYSHELQQDIYWYGLTPDGMNAYDYSCFEEMIDAPVFDGKSLKQVWDSVVIEEMDGCDPRWRMIEWMSKNRDYSTMLSYIYDEGIAPSDYLSSDILWELAKDKDEMVRCDLAKVLSIDHDTETVIDILCILAKDVDSLVRVEAIDSLSVFPCLKSYMAMKAGLEDSDHLVRLYAAFGLAWVGRSISPEEAKSILFESEKRERKRHVKVGIYEGLYILGCEEYLDRLINLFDSKDYHIQCSVLNSLDEMVDVGNVRRIQEFISTIDTDKYPRAVLSTLSRLIQTCEGKCTIQIRR